MADLSVFGQRIKQLRQELGLSQREFAERVDITASALSAYEKGLKNPSVNVAINIAAKFNISMDWLCGLKKASSRFHPDDIIPFDLPSALNSLLTLIAYDVLSLPQTEELQEYGQIDTSCLEVTNGCLEEFIRDARSINDLYANGAISYESFHICMEEMTFGTAEAIRDRRKHDIERREKERSECKSEDTLPF